ncbi:MAG: hypothetical protein HZB55_23280 [Deltaproteobacteria bacterium]|nr:hypothetical protein [Deltaproteobacteria bacterium]
MAKVLRSKSEAAPEAPHVCPTCGQLLGERAPGGEPLSAGATMVAKSTRKKKVAASGEEEATVGKCLKGKSEVSKDEATYVCKRCGARTDDKDHVCKPEKVKKDKKNKEEKKKEKKKKKKDEKKEKKKNKKK